MSYEKEQNTKENIRREAYKVNDKDKIYQLIIWAIKYQDKISTFS